MIDRDSTLLEPEALPNSTLSVAVTARDRLNDVLVAYHFLTEAAYELMHTSRHVELTPKTLKGYGTVVAWVQEQHDQLVNILDQNTG